MSTEQTRHEYLIAAGWQYDPASDMYTAPGAPQGRQYNQIAAWHVYQMEQYAAPPRRWRDPRQQEPE